MDNVELSRTTRLGMVATGLIQGLVCYLLLTWLAPKNDGWLFYGLPATIALSSTLLFTVTSFKQWRLWGWLAAVFIVVLAMSGWVKWQLAGVDGWRVNSVLWCFGCYLLMVVLLLLPWIQRHLNPRPDETRYTQFYNSMWRNTLALLVILVANALVWLVLMLWSELFRLVGITFFKTLFFETDWFIDSVIGVVTALAVILARTQPRLIVAIQKLLTLIATGLLPLVSLLTLLFIVTLPFTGLASISRHVSAAGLLSSLAFFLLLLMAIVRDPQKTSLPYAGALRCMVKTSLLVAPVYVVIAGWAMWVRVAQHGWTPERLHGVLTVLVLLVWSLGYLVSIVRRKVKNPLLLQGKVNLGISLLVVVILLMLNSPALDSWRISVNSQMARYHSGQIKADDLTLYMLYRSGRPGLAALTSLKNDPEFMQDAKRKRELTNLLERKSENKVPLTAEVLAKTVLIAPGSDAPDLAFWRAVIKNSYGLDPCSEDKACVLVSQDLNNDGQRERVLFVFDYQQGMVYAWDVKKKEWVEQGSAQLPDGVTKEVLLRAVKDGKVGTKPKVWRDLTIGDQMFEPDYRSDEAAGQNSNYR
jgi:hypothetical protein